MDDIEETISFQDIIEFDFDSCSFEDLKSLSNTVNGILASKKDKARSNFIAEMKEKAAALGLDDLDFNQIAGTKSSKKDKTEKGKRTPAAPKYRLPDGSATWTGKGKTKKAFKEFLEANPDMSKEDLLIKKESV